MITLYQFSRMLNIPNAGPFCLKLETFMRMAELKYTVYELGDPRKAPNGKLPYIRDSDVEIADSRVIIDYLTTHYDIGLDHHLSHQEKAVAHSFAIMLEEHYYWAILYNRWLTDNWPKLRDHFFKTMPPLVRNFVPNLIQRQVKSDIMAHGLGRHDPNTIYELANQDMKAISDFLEDKLFLMGDRPTQADATLYGMLMNVLHVPLPSPLKEFASRRQNLVSYVERMTKAYFPDYAERLGM